MPDPMMVWSSRSPLQIIAIRVEELVVNNQVLGIRSFCHKTPLIAMAVRSQVWSLVRLNISLRMEQLEKFMVATTGASQRYRSDFMGWHAASCPSFISKYCCSL